MPARPLARRPPPAPGASKSFAVWLVAFILFVRLVFLVAPLFACFVVITALLSSVVEEPELRVGLGLTACLVPALLLRFETTDFLRRRTRLGRPDLLWFVAGVNAALALALGFGFADDVGRALRRHGDWFVGERNGAMARLYRAGLTRAAAYLEHFDPPAELASIVLPPDPKRIPDGPWQPGHEPPEMKPTIIGWFHPLAGPHRALPLSESRRFGATRPQPRPTECELGHCGVDLGGTIGEPVFSIFDGLVERIERDETSGGRAGRYIRIGHKEGHVVSRYIHLDSIRADLREGARIKGGELIGRLGRSGVFHSGPHLHFGVSLRPSGHGKELYIDPEPLLRTWQLATLETVVIKQLEAPPQKPAPPLTGAPPRLNPDADLEASESPAE